MEPGKAHGVHNPCHAQAGRAGEGRRLGGLDVSDVILMPLLMKPSHMMQTASLARQLMPAP